MALGEAVKCNSSSHRRACAMAWLCSRNQDGGEEEPSEAPKCQELAKKLA